MPLDVLHVLSRLFEVLVECDGQLLVRSLLLELGQGLHEDALGVEHVSELAQEQRARIAHLYRHRDSFVVCSMWRPGATVGGPRALLSYERVAVRARARNMPTTRPAPPASIVDQVPA